ncbi:group II intron reverse transcriptase/maturase [Neobacillus rhizophilus]|uniref:Group II intron reverse transcriptase/maturase n=1 Tax=Neobacillus rhizophilus TaxID=2833579 RepID=A0A942U788_9BACI|nr:group II intron reverse transcriptase/maturase [Neobacillus rhizophilus]MBU8916078.1 group II intron reverse transcriptase/maturase [Bacillus sp. FJAT-29953]MBS4211320.1 group II intron reverse transcriptase/maturase [Neobacillus rhizophilus]MBS4212314.1 group II intron reverse transcriptase/maturase [Neobacillus rhizophilus]MBS4213244.1 group II intron reverse transcriptase/maturase [Neobacillus rhizophilus]MBS4216025.1 group II intron reverse transcriptase/maturase [Neobacillus rhizophilu
MELLEQILSNQNMNEAYLRVYKNKGASGIDGITVDELKRYLKENKDELRQRIRTRKYQPQAALRVEIPKENGKMRMLGIPTVVDRVVQQAIHQVLSPIFEKQFSEFSYGFRPKRSCEMAIIKSLEILNDGHDWVVDIDLERFFDTVHHDKLMRIIANTIDDGDVISLIRKYLVSGVMVNGKYKETPVGTPQGGNLSPLLSNIMLNELDKELESRGLRFVRYADDSLIFVKSEQAANRVMKSIVRFIEGKLGLIVNAEKSKISRPKELKFLGFGYYYDFKTERYQVKPHPKSLQKFQRKLRQLTKRNGSVSLDFRILKLKQVIFGWVNYFRIANMRKAMTQIDMKLRSRIRVIIWKQWKVPRKQIKSLIQLGIPEEEAKGLTFCRKGYRYIGLSKVVQRAISNKRLKQRGIPSALERYLKVHTVI